MAAKPNEPVRETKTYIKHWRLELPIDENGRFDENGEFLWRVRFATYHYSFPPERLEGTIQVSKQQWKTEGCVDCSYEGETYHLENITSEGVYYKRQPESLYNMTPEDIKLLHDVPTPNIEEIAAPIDKFCNHKRCEIEGFAKANDKKKTVRSLKPDEYER